MKVLELIYSLEEAYDRFGDIEINIMLGDDCRADCPYGDGNPKIKELIIESEEFIIKCE